MLDYISRRAKSSGALMIEKNLTVRKLADIVGVSKSTTHKDITERLEKIDPDLYNEVRKLLDYNIKMRSIRGGQALKEKNSKK